MKKIILLFALFWFGLSQAQNFITHTADAGNISFSASFIDHPELNNNPSARIIAVHNWNPPGSVGVYNQSPTGVYYEAGSINRWAVFNEDGSNMLEDTSYNIYIANDAAITHLHSGDAIHPDPVYSIVNHPVLNGNPSAIAVMSTYWNPSGVWNNANYGFWYDDVGGADEWIIYNEGLNTIPADAGFFVATENPNVASMRHQATGSNISNNWTTIDHPLLNGDPNAIFVFSHNWGVSGQSSNVVLDKTLGAWYDGSNWAIYTEDISAMPENATFDLLIYDPNLSTVDETLFAVSVYPNPVIEWVYIEASEIITNISIYNNLGQLVVENTEEETKLSMDLSFLTSGVYYAKIEVGSTNQTVKIVKK
ncbi:MAG: T9SS type A sorting domain-containing protein [Flavobacteriaceae bacterium]|nr:T9SS type A sorting domain-containing protein [Flavobacteriaceae bacterium]